MDGIMFSLAALAGALLLVGTAGVGGWIIQRREQDKTRVIRDAVFAACAAREVAK